MLATDPNNLIGQFAGPALATSLVVVSEEAVYAKNPEVADKLKGMITQRDMQVAATGCSRSTLARLAKRLAEAA